MIPLRLERKLKEISEMMKGTMSPNEYKYLVLGLVFLKLVTERFYALVRENNLTQTEMDDVIRFRYCRWQFIPPTARYDYILNRRDAPAIGDYINDAMRAVESEMPILSGVLYKNYGHPDINKRKLSALIDVIGSIEMYAEDTSTGDIIGRVYEYFLFSNDAGEFYTPKSIVELLVGILNPLHGIIYDPTCGTGGMFLQSQRLIDYNKAKELYFIGQESSIDSWRLAKMNMVVANVRADLGNRPADTLHEDIHADTLVDYAMANPPYNMKDWGADALALDPRWAYGIPPNANANFAWIQHVIYHLKPTGRAGIVMSNNTLSSGASNEGDIRMALIKHDLVECVISLPDKLFYNTSIPVCVWIIAKQKPHRRKQTLFIDCRDMGVMIDRKQRTLSGDDVERIVDTYHKWRDNNDLYTDIVGFCMSAGYSAIFANDGALTPGRYVGQAQKSDDAGEESFEDTMRRLTADLANLDKEGARLSKRIAHNMAQMGFGAQPDIDATVAKSGKYAVYQAEDDGNELFIVEADGVTLEIPRADWGEFARVIAQAMSKA